MIYFLVYSNLLLMFAKIAYGFTQYCFAWQNSIKWILVLHVVKIHCLVSLVDKGNNFVR